MNAPLHGRVGPGPELSEAFPFDEPPESRLPLYRQLWLPMVCILYVLLGLVGHDPWKQDETYSFGMVLHILQSGDWVVPQVAGEPFMEKPPLYYLTAAALAKAFSPWLELHDGARLASGLFLLIALVCFGGAAREWLGRERLGSALTYLLGAAGLLVTHFMFTDVALFAGCGIAFYGLALLQRRPVVAGLLLGTGAGVCFMSKGVLLPAILGLTVLVVPIPCKSFRTRAYARALAVAALASMPWLLIWPLALWQRSPDLFAEWFWMNNVGRFVGFAVAKYGAENISPWYWLSALPWFAFPLSPLVAWSLARLPRREFQQPGVAIPILFSTIMIIVLVISATARALYALPLLMPFALIAARPSGAIAPAADRAWMRFNALFFGVLALLIWVVFAYLLASPDRPLLAPIARVLPLDYRPEPVAWHVLLAAALTVAWAFNFARLPEKVQRGPATWLAGLILMLGLISSLWLPWINAAKSYRDEFTSLARQLPQQHDCVASANLGESEKAMLQYFAGVVTERKELHPDAACSLLLVQGQADDTSDLGPQWRLIWEGNRQGDFRERHRLYVQTDSAVATLINAPDALPAEPPHDAALMR